MGESTLNDPQDIAEGFNEYFSNIGPDLASKIDTSSCNFKAYVKKATSEFAAFQPTTVNDIIHVDYQPIKRPALIRFRVKLLNLLNLPYQIHGHLFLIRLLLYLLFLMNGKWLE